MVWISFLDGWTDVRSDIVSEAVVPLIVTSNETDPKAPSWKSHVNECVNSPSRLVKSRTALEGKIDTTSVSWLTKNSICKRPPHRSITTFVEIALAVEEFSECLEPEVTYLPMKSSRPRDSLSQRKISKRWDWSSNRWKSNCSSHVTDEHVKLHVTDLVLYFSLPNLGGTNKWTSQTSLKET